MRDFQELPADEQQTVKDEVARLYDARGGEDIDRAVRRDRKVLELHEKELDHVATLPFDQHYRWRIAPSVGLRAQKDLERQLARREELLRELFDEVLHARGYIKPRREEPMPTAREVQALASQFAEVINEFKDWQAEGMEASPPVSSAA